MRCLLVHNYYQNAGGEDEVFRSEAALLRSNGHHVVEYARTNYEIRGYGAWNNLLLGVRTTWAADSVRQLRRILKREKPDIVHLHNTFPLISPAVYFTCEEAGVPTVQTLHNYRLLCPAATLFRHGQVCERCLGREVAWPGILHGCYRDSTLATAAVSAMLAAHRFLGSWQTKVDSYIALTEFARRKFIQGGLPASRIRVKPNFVHPDPGPKVVVGEYALFVGRLSEEKGPAILLKAWNRLKNPIPLIIAGDGPMSGELNAMAERLGKGHVKMVGHMCRTQIVNLLHNARMLVFPSVWYEGAFPLSIIEAFACGVPVIASRLGAMQEGVAEYQTGLHFSAGDSRDLADQCDWAWDHSNEMLAMGRAARLEYENRYTAGRNYEMMMDIYRSVIDSRKIAA